MENNKYISVSAAARLAGVSGQTILNMCHNKAISCRLNGNIYTVLESDVKAYASKIQDIQVSLAAIEGYKDRMAKMAKDLHDTMIFTMRDNYEQTKMLQMYPARIKATNQMLLAWIEQMEKYKDRIGYSFTWRQVDVLISMLEGKTQREISEKLGLSTQRVNQIWHKALRVFVKCKNHIDFMEEQISDLKKSIQDKNNEIARLNAIIKGEPMPEPITADMKMAKLLSRHVESFNLSTRTLSCLATAEVHTLRQLVSCDPRNLLKWRNFGRKSLRELEDLLESNGLSWKMDVSIYPEVVA